MKISKNIFWEKNDFSKIFSNSKKILGFRTYLDEKNLTISVFKTSFAQNAPKDIIKLLKSYLFLVLKELFELFD